MLNFDHGTKPVYCVLLKCSDRLTCGSLRLPIGLVGKHREGHRIGNVMSLHETEV